MHLKFLLIRILVCTIGDISLFLFCNFAAANANIPANDITVGSQVCMRKAPIYHAGSIGYTVSGGIPKVGHPSRWTPQARTLISLNPLARNFDNVP